MIGEGAFAAVRRVRRRSNGEWVAMKVVEKYPLIIRDMLPQLHREVKIQGSLHHRHILRLLSSFEDDHYVFFFLEYCAGGSLRTLSARMPGMRFPEPLAARYFAQILQGVDHMHGSGCVHRDLKPDNILLTQQGEIRICDFGWSAEIQAERALQTTCGTPNYWAPEIFEGLPQGPPIDLWALGNLIYEMLVGHAPFWGSSEELRQKVLAVDLRYPPDVLSSDAVHVFHCLLQRSPAARAPAAWLLAKHPWLRVAEGSGWDGVGNGSAPNSPMGSPLAARASMGLTPLELMARVAEAGEAAGAANLRGRRSWAPQGNSANDVFDAWGMPEPPPKGAGLRGGHGLGQEDVAARPSEAPGAKPHPRRLPCRGRSASGPADEAKAQAAGAAGG